MPFGAAAYWPPRSQRYVRPASITVAGRFCYIARGSDGALGRFSESDPQEVDRTLGITGADAFPDRNLDSHSGGERQRRWLAMLMAKSAEMLLLDEPASARDPAHQRPMLDLL